MFFTFLALLIDAFPTDVTVMAAIPLRMAQTIVAASAPRRSTPGNLQLTFGTDRQIPIFLRRLQVMDISEK
jgi:hypothetical protein